VPTATLSAPPPDRPGLVPVDPAFGRAFRLAYYTVRLAQNRRVGLECALEWLETAAVLDTTVEQMSHRLDRFIDDITQTTVRQW
jgi:hypothetical protein